MRKKLLLIILALTPYIISWLFFYLWKLVPIEENKQGYAFAEFWATIPIFVNMFFIPFWLWVGIRFKKYFKISFIKSFIIANGLGIISLIFAIFYYTILKHHINESLIYDFIANGYWSPFLVIGNFYTGTIFALFLFIAGYFISAKEL